MSHITTQPRGRRRFCIGQPQSSNDDSSSSLYLYLLPFRRYALRSLPGMSEEGKSALQTPWLPRIKYWHCRVWWKRITTHYLRGSATANYYAGSHHLGRGTGSYCLRRGGRCHFPRRQGNLEDITSNSKRYRLFKQLGSMRLPQTFYVMRQSIHWTSSLRRKRPFRPNYQNQSHRDQQCYPKQNKIGCGWQKKRTVSGKSEKFTQQNAAGTKPSWLIYSTIRTFDPQNASHRPKKRTRQETQ